MRTTRCPGYGRHWYSFHGQSGFRSPVCVRCGHPNPRPLTGDEWDVLLQYREARGRPFRDFIEAAVSARKGELLWNRLVAESRELAVQAMARYAGHVVR